MTFILSKVSVAIIMILQSFLFAFFSLMVFFGYYMTRNRRISDYSETEYNENMTRLQYRSFDFKSNTSSSGIIKAKESMKNLGIFSYDEDTRIASVISEFGSEEYECYGECFCDDDHNERKSASSTKPLTKTFTYIVSALSSLLALEAAIDFFDEECDDFLRDICKGDRITSSSSSRSHRCSKIHYIKDQIDPVPDEERPHRFICNGNCLPSILRKEEFIQISTKFNCERFEREAEVSIMCNGRSNPVCATSARMKFKSEFLTKYCPEVSKIEYWYVKKNSDRFRRTASLCVGGKKGKNNSVGCSRIWPEYPGEFAKFEKEFKPIADPWAKH